MGHMEDGEIDSFLKPLELELYTAPDISIQGRERLIKEKNLRFGDDSPGKSHPLLFSATQR